jgi:hypothetical protein
MHATHSLFQATSWPMNPFEKLFGKSLSSSLIMEGTNHMRKNFHNIWQQNFGCCDRASWLTWPSNFWFSPTLSISPRFMTPMPITNLPQNFYSCLILDTPSQFMHKFSFAFQDLQLPCRLLAPLGPLIPSLHMLPKSHVDSWFISAS